jgi:hypothetical protein
MRQLILLISLVLLLAGCDTSNKPAISPSSNAKAIDFSFEGVLKNDVGLVSFEAKAKNVSGDNIVVLFSSGQKWEIVITGDHDTELYRYSAGRMFTEATSQETLVPDDAFVLEGEIPRLAEGTYKVHLSLVTTGDQHFVEETTLELKKEAKS